MSAVRVAVAATGVANLASVLAALARVGAEAAPTSDADALAEAELAVLPGVGAFGAAMAALRSRGLDRAFAERWRRGAPSLGVCLGMQLFFEGSEESPNVDGLGLLRGVARRFSAGLPLPQLGWNYASAEEGSQRPVRILREGWAYFANSYRLDAAPDGAASLSANYGERFVAALEAGPVSGGRPALLLCQFHPELSGTWGAELLARWLRPEEGGEA